MLRTGMSINHHCSPNLVLIELVPRPFDLDDAVLRRLPRRILVDLPGPKEREGMLNIGSPDAFFTRRHRFADGVFL